MKVVIFGLSVSSSWGNGHAALWRGLIRALVEDRHQVVFFERDVPYYSNNRDLHELPAGSSLIFYNDWNVIRSRMLSELHSADVGMVTSYCPDGRAATELLTEANVGIRCFYDLDTPVTLSRLERGEAVDYIGPTGLSSFDLVLSYTGGEALELLRSRLGARKVQALYGSVDPNVHKPVPPKPHYASSLSYLGTYAPDRQETLERLFIEPASRLPSETFLIGGAQYPDSFPWRTNIHFVRHLPPAEHSSFYSSSKVTLNVTRQAMARMGWCPSGRLFEAAACGVPIISDWFAGLSDFFEPGVEILVASSTTDVVDALALDPQRLETLARRSRERVLDLHTARCRAIEMVAAFSTAATEVV